MLRHLHAVWIVAVGAATLLGGAGGAESDNQQPTATLRSAATPARPGKCVVHHSSHPLSKRVQASVDVFCDAAARLSSNFEDRLAGEEVRFGAYHLILLGSEATGPSMLFQEMGMIKRLPDSAEPYESRTRLSKADFEHFSEECGVHNESDLLVSVAPAPGLTWGQVTKRDQVHVAVRLDPVN
ncbi:MAG: hypothetical protein JNN27_06605 [Planctomycetes bacterium]|nr:hypothetical protein [Planctomycetota bacterium]